MIGHARQRPFGGRLLVFVAVGLAAAVAAWATWPAWQAPFLLSIDGPRHALRAREMYAMLIEDGRVDGWSPVWYLGVPLFLFQSYAYYFLQALIPLVIRIVEPGYADMALAWAVRAASAVPLVALPLLSYRLSRRLAVGRLGAGLAAWAALCVSTDTGYGATAAFHVGLELHTVGILFVAALLPEIADPPTWHTRRFYVIAAALGVVLVTHLISGAHLLLATLCFGAWQALASKNVAPFLYAAAVTSLAILVAGHALFPAIELYDTMGASVGWEWRNRLFELATLSHFGPRTLTGLAFTGLFLAAAARRTPARTNQRDGGGAHALAWPLANAERRRRIAWLALVLLVVGAAPRMWGAPRPARILLDVLQPRALAVVALLLPVYAGYAAENVLTALRARPRLKVPIATLATLWLAAVMGARLLNVHRLAASASTLADRQTAECRDTLAWLHDHARPDGVVAWESRALTAKNCATESIASLVHLTTGMVTLSGDQAELTRFQRRHVFAGDATDAPSPTRLARRIRRYRSSYVVARSPGLVRRLEQTGLLTRAARFGGLTILERQDRALAITGHGLHVYRESLARSRAAWIVENTRAGAARATIAISYHPAWRAHLDGRPVELRPTTDGLMAVTLPRGTHHLRVTFDRRKIERLYYAASGVALGMIAAGVAAGRRR